MSKVLFITDVFIYNGIALLKNSKYNGNSYGFSKKIFRKLHEIQAIPVKYV